MRKLKLLTIVLACSVAFIFSACSSNSKTSQDEAFAAPRAAEMSEEKGDFYTGGGSTGDTNDALVEKNSDSSTALFNNQNQPNLKLIWYANLDLETLNYEELMKGLNKTLTEMEGFVESSSQSGGLDVYGTMNERYSDLTIRIPSAKLDEFLNTVSTLGNVTYQNKRSENITLEYADNEARLATLKIEYEKLLELLERAEDLESVIALEARLSDVRYQMDGLSSALSKYDNLVDYSTVTVSIYEVEVMTEKPDDTLGSRISLGFKNTLIDVKNAGEDLIVFGVVKAPFIIAIIAIAYVIIGLLKKATKNNSLKPLKSKMYKNQDLTYPKVEDQVKSENIEKKQSDDEK